MPDPNDFDDLAREFQRIDVDEQAHVARRFRRARLRTARQMTVGVAIALTLAVIALRKLWLDRDGPAVAFAVVEIGVPLVLVGAMGREHRKLWRATSATVRGFLEFEIARTSAEIRMALLLFRVAPFLALGVAVFQFLLLRQTPHVPRVLLHAPLAATAGLAGPYVILVGVLLFNRRKKVRLARERAALEAELRRLTEEVETA